MAQYYSDICLRYLRLAALLCLATAAGLPNTASALTRTELYQTVVPVADRSDGAQAGAFQAAMRVVVVRVTGRRSADGDPAFAPLVSNSRRYVQQYRGAPDNKLWVSFDGPAIERWLTQNGQPLWGAERPVTFVWLEVQAGQTGAGAAPTPAAGPSGGVVSADDTSELKTSIDAAAAVRGIPLIWPNAADAQKGRADAAGAGAIAEMARSRGAVATLVGRASNATAGASVRWTHVFQDRSSEFSGALEGINRAADTYAGLFAASGTLAPVDIEVSGVADLQDYASVQGYLESLTFISRVSVLGLTGDLVRFRLTTRGGIESLQRALSLNGKLQSVAAGDDGIQRFQLRR
jgi:uncharacterized protein